MDWFDELKRTRAMYRDRARPMDDTRPIAEGITDADVDKLFAEVESLRQQLNIVADVLDGKPPLHIAFVDFPHAHNLREMLSRLRRGLAERERTG